MYKVEQPDYPVAAPVLTDLSSIHVAITSVLDGTLAGEILVDSQPDPRVAIVICGDGYFLAGDPTSSAATIENVREIIPDWAYLYAEEFWFPYLERAWCNEFALEHPRLRMGLTPGTPLPPSRLPVEGFEIAPIDRALFSREPHNLAYLQEAVEEWVSPEAFFKSAIGYCVLHEGGIVSHSLTDSVCGKRCEIGVGTEPVFRRKGLGTLVSSLTVRECVRRGHNAIEWHTYASNKGSISIARAIGLVELDRYSVHSCRLPAENVGDLSPEKCRKLAAHFELASKKISWCRFPAAGAWALAGERARAIENIRRLFESNWQGSAEWLEEFWALQSLQGDGEFESLIAAYKQ